MLFEVGEGLESWLFRGVFRTRVLDITFWVFLQNLCHFWCPWAPKGSPWGHPEITIRGKNRTLVPRGSPGAFQGAKSEHFGGHLVVFGESFLMYFWWTSRSVSCYSHKHVSTCSFEFWTILCGLGTLLDDYFSSTFATLPMFHRGWFMCLGLSEIRVYSYSCHKSV